MTKAARVPKGQGAGDWTEEQLEWRRRTHTSCIYALIDPRTQQVRYIGHTSAFLTERLKGHLADAVRGTCSKKRGEWLRELLAQGLVPQIVELRKTNYVDGFELEDQVIAEYVAAGYDLVNVRGVVKATPKPKPQKPPRRRPVQAMLREDTYEALRRGAIAREMTIYEYMELIIDRACEDE